MPQCGNDPALSRMHPDRLIAWPKGSGGNHTHAVINAHLMLGIETRLAGVPS